MRHFALVLQVVCIFFALFLSYGITQTLLSQEYDLMEVVGDVGTVLICIDLAVFLWHSRSLNTKTVQDFATRLEQPAPKLVKLTRKLGHLGIMLILCSWLVPLTQ